MAETTAASLSSSSSPSPKDKMEGWLYLVRSSRFGLQHSSKRYFVLQRYHDVREDNRCDDDGDGDNVIGDGSSNHNNLHHVLRGYKSIPSSKSEVPIRSSVIDSGIRVTDNGRENIHRRVLFMFTLYNTSNHNDQLKLGASSPEEAARWIHSFHEAAVKGGQNVFNHSRNLNSWQSFRLTRSRRGSRVRSIDWTLCSSTSTDAVADVIAPSTWTIFGCQNGLRLFKEAKERDSPVTQWDDHPAIMAVCVIDGTSEAVFQTLMSLGPSRSEWDFCFYKGNVVEHLDGHTDIIHKQLYKDWLPWGMKRRDLLLQRYWRREDDGTYVILYHSVFHKKCPPQKGYVRACLKSGGYVVTPVSQGKRSVVKHMLAIDWKFWKSYIQTSSARSITICMLGRIAALRELYKAKLGKFSLSEFSSVESVELGGSPISHPSDDNGSLPCLGDNNWVGDSGCEEAGRPSSDHASLVGFNDTADEFFDVPEPSDDEHVKNGWSYQLEADSCSQGMRTPKICTAAGFVKKLHDLAVQKRGGYVDLQEVKEESVSWSCGTTLPKDASYAILSSWAMGDPSSFLIRGKSYLEDQKKVKAKTTLMQMVGADWLKSDKREDDLAGRPESIVQKCAAQGGSEFFFIVNIQVPGSTTYSLALYYMLTMPLEDTPLLESFVRGDDAYRNSRFKLIPYISKGSWIVKQSVGKKACIIGQALEINYFHGKNYIEMDVDVGSSTVARGVVSLVLGYLSNLIIEMAFLVQANTEEELPEWVLGTCRLNHLDVSKAVSLI